MLFISFYFFIIMAYILKIRSGFTICFVILYLKNQFIKYIIEFNYYFNQDIYITKFPVIMYKFFLNIVIKILFKISYQNSVISFS